MAQWPPIKYAPVKLIAFLSKSALPVTISKCLKLHVVTRLKTSLSMRGAGLRLPSRSNRTQCRQRLPITAMFLRSCVTQALSRRDRPCECRLIQICFFVFFYLRLKQCDYHLD